MKYKTPTHAALVKAISEIGGVCGHCGVDGKPLPDVWVKSHDYQVSGGLAGFKAVGCANCSNSLAAAMGLWEMQRNQQSLL